MSTASSFVHCSTVDNIATIKLDNFARHNSLERADMETFIGHLDAIESNATVRALILTGSGDKTFCAGASLAELSSGDMDGSFFTRLTDKLAACPLPTICALNGSVYGGGAELALCCDFRLGVHGMRLMVPPARLGICYPANGIKRYVQRLGLNTAKRILLTSLELDSKELLQVGYLTQLVAPGELETATLELAQQLVSLAPLSLRGMKQICDQAASGQVDAASAAAWIARCEQSADLQEGLLAISEKRAPVFSGQ